MEKTLELMTPKEFDRAYSAWADARWNASRYAGQGINLSAGIGQFVPRNRKSFSIDEVHQNALKTALQQRKPVSARAINAYRIKLPEGYVREGNHYVFVAEGKI